MKKIIIRLSLAMGLTTPLFAAPLSTGFYGGYSVFGVHRPVDTKIKNLEYADQGGTIKIEGCNKTNSTRYVNHSLFGGFAYYGVSPYMVAFEGNIDGPNHEGSSMVWPSVSAMLTPPPSPTIPGRAPAAAVAAPTPLKCNVKTKFERGFVLGGAIRVGYVMPENYVLYGKVGIETSKNKATVSYEVVTPAMTLSHQSSASKWHPTLVAGAGLEKHLDNGLFLRAEYNYVFGRKMTVPLVVKPDFAPSVGYRAHVARLGVGYRFSL